ncbi:MAG: glutathione S-transferase family protein [Pseudomonadota bacterium]|jgi:glutathione S-transferase|nr:glutathione S-transferase family protein [Pseudomonadota bacterium]
MSAALTLVSHTLCPYVQRAAIALTEKSVPFERIYIDLADKPGWFTDLSPLGKVPVLKVAQDGRESAIFESAVILEYIEETQPHPLHPSDPLDRARHRSWIEYGSQILNRIGAVYSAPDDAALTVEKARLDQMLERLEDALGAGPWFAGAEFSLVDAVYGPIFRYFDVLDRIPAAAMPSGLPKARAWRKVLAERPSVVAAVSPDYPALLTEFLRRRGKALSRAMVPA